MFLPGPYMLWWPALRASHPLRTPEAEEPVFWNVPEVDMQPGRDGTPSRRGSLTYQPSRSSHR